MGADRVFFHVDLDAFFAAVEQRDRPELAGKPVIVGASPGHRGVVSTCSYEARAFGVHSAMPISEAVRRCPGGVYLPVRMERYAEVSRIVMGIFGDFTPDVLPVSIDEAFLDMTGTDRLWGSPEEAGKKLKEAVKSTTGLTISVGIAANRYVAKIASGLRKPDGLVAVPRGGEDRFMEELPLSRLWGAGERTRERFDELGISSMRDLRSFSEAVLVSLFGKSSGAFLFAASRGIDRGIYGGEPRSRSIGTETTFETDVRDAETFESVLLGMSEQLASRLYSGGNSARTIAVKIRSFDFETVSARHTRRSPFASSGDIYADALSLFRQKWDGRPVRLVGLSLSSFSGEEALQGSLFADEAEARPARMERAVFEAELKGIGKVTRARLLPDPAERKGP